MIRIVRSCVVALPALSTICTEFGLLPGVVVANGKSPFGSSANPERSSAAPVTWYEAALPSTTGALGQVSVNVGAVLSILMTSLFDASMLPLTSTDRAVTVVWPALVIVNGPVYFVHGASAAPSSL